MDKKDMNMDMEQEETKTSKKNIYMFIFLFILLITGIMTFSFAFQRDYLGMDGGSSTSNNTIQTGDILFSYSDNSGYYGSGPGGNGSNFPANGIYITNAFPMLDEEGKVMVGNHTYFDFQVTGNPREGNPLEYKVILEKMAESTLSDSDVKVYVTNLKGNREIAVPETLLIGSVKVYSQYDDFKSNVYDGKLLFTRRIEERGYNEKYRLRLWVRQYAEDYSQKTFSAKVNLVATSAK